MSIDADRIEGNWKQFKGRVKEKWGALTDDDFQEREGHREYLIGKIQEKYGDSKDKIRGKLREIERSI